MAAGKCCGSAAHTCIMAASLTAEAASTTISQARNEASISRETLVVGMPVSRQDDIVRYRTIYGTIPYQYGIVQEEALLPIGRVKTLACRQEREQV
jgi:hypothetical protein